MTSYADFLAAKRSRIETPGREVTATDIHPMLHDWQNELVRWAVRTGRAAIWADTGMGKTVMQLEWARLSASTSLVIAPLAVCQQTVREASKLGIDARYIRHYDAVDGPGIYVTNYEQVPNMLPNFFGAVVLDESSILKQSDGKTRTMLIDWSKEIPHRLACSATPAPNDPEELTNQAEWLGRMTRTHMLAAYFIHDQDGWRMKGHAKRPMLEWMSQWAVALRKPSDVGGDDTGYQLPGLDIQSHLLPVDIDTEGQLFATELGGVTGRSLVRKQTLAARVDQAAKLVANEPDEPWLIWCGLNAEAEALAAAIPGSVNVHGAMDADDKARLLLAFGDGEIPVLVTKPQIASLGMNWQVCARMAFVGLGDSFEMYYQALRRCYRYGQKRVVEAHVILSELESQIADNVKAKERQANDIIDGLIALRRKGDAA